MTKTLILDTNVLLTDPDSLYAFEENEIILPFTTIEELDKIKSRTNEVGANAREVARRLSEMISENEQGALKRGVKLPSGGILRLVAVSDFIFDEDEKFGKDWDPTNKDNHILDVCRGLTKQHREEGKPDPVLISRDILLRVKCDFLGIPCEDYKNSHVTDNVDRIYTGSTLLDVEEDVIQEFWECSRDITRDFYLKLDPEFEQELVPNQFLLLQDPNSEDEQAVRYSDSGEPLKIVHDIKSPVYGLLPRNKEQNLAMDLLLDQDIKLVTLLGLAGCGKTLLALAAGLNQVIEKKRYKKLFICRPIVPVGNDIGFLPGPVPLYTNVLTPDGWKKMGDIKKNDHVIAKDGKPTRVSGIYPKGQKEILEITFEDGVTIECCEDHPWSVYSVSNPKPKVMQTKDIEKRQDELGWDKKSWNRLFIDIVEPVKYSPLKEKLSIHPYVLGCILGDGCVSQQYANEFSSNDEEIVENINNFMPNNIVLKHKSGYSYSFTMKSNVGKKKRKNNVITEAINRLGLRGTNSKTKFIPENYLFASVEERLLLLQGLMDTDGYVSKDSQDVSFTTISKELADGVKNLVLSLGGLANIKNYPHKHNSYTVSISFSNSDMCPFLLDRKAIRWQPRKNRILRRIESVKRTGKYTEMQCISVEHPEHLYVMDNFVVTHNTKEEKLEPWIAPIKDNLRYLLFSSTGGRKSRQNEMTFNNFFEDGLIEIEAIAYLRGRSISDAYIIIDECFPYSQNINTENGKMPIGKLVSLFNKGEKIPKVLAYDEKNKNFVYKNIKNAWSNGYKSLIKIKSSNRNIECTENHPFLVKDKGYVKARELAVGDLLVTTKPKTRSQLLKTWNEDQEQIILGSYLGDGNISKNGLNRYRLKVVHGEAQKNYCQFKSDILNSFTSQIKQNGYSKHPAIKFTTLMFGSKINFDSNKKTCSLEILNKLNPKGLAIWFMDDGSVYPNKNGARISTCSFDEESQKNFVNYFHSLGMKNVNYKEYYSKSKDKSYYYLIFNKEDYCKLSSLIEPYTHPELSYKVINQNLVGTYKWNSCEEESGVTVVDAIDLNPGISKEVFDIEVEDLHNFVICSTRASKNNSGIVVHNCQNLTAHELKTIITRVGENTKIVLTGDIDQIDNMYIDAKSNGLTIAIEKFKPYKIAGHIKLVKGERSELATLASSLL